MQAVEVTVAIPQLHRVRHPRVVDICVVTTEAVSLGSFPQLQFIDMVFDVPVVQGRASFVKVAQGELVGPSAQAQSQGLTPRHQGGEGVPGSPGVYSQVTWHAN